MINRRNDEKCACNLKNWFQRRRKASLRNIPYRKNENPTVAQLCSLVSSFVFSIEHARSRKLASKNMIHTTCTQACSIETVALTRQLSTPLGMSKTEAGQ